MTECSAVAEIIGADKNFRGEEPFRRFATALRKRVPGTTFDYSVSVLTLRCPLCKETAYVMANASALGEAIWCSGNCEDEEVAKALLPIAMGERLPADDLGLAAPASAKVTQPVGTKGNSIRDQFPLLEFRDLVDPNRPARRWFWQDVIPDGDHISLIAPAGTGKSLFVQALCVAYATGSAEFVGRTLSTEPGRRVLYIDMENTEDDLAERFKDLGVTLDNVDSIATCLLLLHMPQLRGLDTEQGASQLVAVIDEYEITAGDVLILDSTQRVTEGEENSNDTVRRLYNFTSIELKRRGLTVIRTDNTGHEGGRARGASAKRDDVAASWLLGANSADPELFTLKPLKRRSKGSSTDISFRRTVAPVTGLLTFVPEQAPSAGTSTTTGQAADLVTLSQLVPPPRSKEDVRARLGWGSARAMRALQAWRSPGGSSAP